MKKLKWIIPIIVILCVGAVIFFVFRNNGTKTLSKESEKKPDYIETVLPLLRMSDLQNIKNTAEKKGIKWQKYNNGLYEGFSDIQVSDMKATALFELDDKNITNLSAKFVSDKKASKKIDVIKSCVDDAKFIFSTLFDIDTSGESYLYHNEGYILDDKDDSYKMILSGDAKFSLLVKDTDQSFWRIEGYMEEDYFAVYANRYLNPEIYKDAVPNFDLTKQ